MKIILGVGGGIAAYKSAELARLLMQQGHQVQAVMTEAAQRFVTPMTFAALTGRKVLTDLFAIENAIDHIGTAQENDLLVVAPATADVLPVQDPNESIGWPGHVRLALLPPRFGDEALARQRVFALTRDQSTLNLST